MLKTKIRLSIALPLLIVVAVAAVGFSDHMATVKTTKPDVIWTEQACIKCHTNDKTIRAMQDKAGDTKKWSTFLSPEAKAAGKCPVPKATK
jgi:hypothetical protein